MSGTKRIHYIGNTSLICGTGGLALELIKGEYVNQCWLGNLDKDCTTEDLFDLFDEFFKLKNITMFEDVNKECNSSII